MDIHFKNYPHGINSRDFVLQQKAQINPHFGPELGNARSDLDLCLDTFCTSYRNPYPETIWKSLTSLRFYVALKPSKLGRS